MKQHEVDESKRRLKAALAREIGNNSGNSDLRQRFERLVGRLINFMYRYMYIVTDVVQPRRMLCSFKTFSFSSV